MLFYNDPSREFDNFFNRPLGRSSGSLTSPIDAYRRGDDVWVHVDLPGVSDDSLEIDVERNVLTIAAERNWQHEDGDQPYLRERPRGSFRRQVHLGDGLDPEQIEANFSDGVLTLRIPIAEKAKPRKIKITPAGTAAIESESVETGSPAA